MKDVIIDKYFNKSLNQASPVIPEYARVVDYDEKGNEFISYQPVDTKKIIKSNGKVTDWQLNSLLKSGINPAFGIHTGEVSRIEGVETLNVLERDVDMLLAKDE